MLGSIPYCNLCAGTLVVVCVGLAGLQGPGTSAQGGEAMRTGLAVAMEGCAGVMGLRGALTAGHMSDEELDNAIDLEI